MRTPKIVKALKHYCEKIDSKYGPLYFAAQTALSTLPVGVVMGMPLDQIVYASQIAAGVGGGFFAMVKYSSRNNSLTRSL